MRYDIINNRCDVIPQYIQALFGKDLFIKRQYVIDTSNLHHGT